MIEIEEIKDQIDRQNEMLFVVSQNKSDRSASAKIQLIERRLKLLREEAYLLAKHSNHPCPIMYKFYGERASQLAY